MIGGVEFECKKVFESDDHTDVFGLKLPKDIISVR